MMYVHAFPANHVPLVAVGLSVSGNLPSVPQKEPEVAKKPSSSVREERKDERKFFLQEQGWFDLNKEEIRSLRTEISFTTITPV